MKSLQQMLDQCEGLIGTKDVNPWEDKFLQDMVEMAKTLKKQNRTLTGWFTDKQFEVLQRIYNKHFA